MQDRLDQLGKLIGADETTKPILLAPEEDKRILIELFKIRAGLHNEMEILEESRQDALESQKEALAKIHIRARKKIHPKTTIIIGGKSITLTKPESATQLHWDPEKGGIAIKGL